MNNMNNQISNSNRLHIAIIIAAAIISVGWIMKGEQTDQIVGLGKGSSALDISTEVTIVDGGHILPIEMEEMMAKELVEIGVIDPTKLPEATELNLLWAFGLANKNQVLTEGPMMDKKYGGPENMASVGGWTVSHGHTMGHYAVHNLLELDPKQQVLLEKVSKNIFRPCCRNSTYFPDCNHGMAMLALLEILAYQGATEDEMNLAARKANGIWFPGTSGGGDFRSSQTLQNPPYQCS